MIKIFFTCKVLCGFYWFPSSAIYGGFSSCLPSFTSLNWDLNFFFFLTFYLRYFKVFVKYFRTRKWYLDVYHFFMWYILLLLVYLEAINLIYLPEILKICPKSLCISEFLWIFHIFSTFSWINDNYLLNILKPFLDLSVIRTFLKKFLFFKSRCSFWISVWRAGAFFIAFTKQNFKKITKKWKKWCEICGRPKYESSIFWIFF